MMLPGIGGPLGEAMIDSVVLFDKNTGEVAHVHQVFTIPGATRPSKDQVECEARAILADCDVDATAFGSLNVEPHELKPLHEYRVDVKRSMLVATPVELPTRSGKKAGRRPTRRK